MNPFRKGASRARVLTGLISLAAILVPARSDAIAPKQGWTPASFGMLAECGTANPPSGYLFPGAGCMYTTRIKFSPLAPGLAYAGTLGHGLWFSSGGENWVPLSPKCITGLSTVGKLSLSYAEGKDGLTACGIEDIAFDPLDSKVIYAAGMNVSGIGLNSFSFDPGGIFRSDDAGQSWVDLTKNVPNIRAVSIAVIHEPGHQPIIMTGNIQHADHDVGVDRSLAISFNGGTSWSSVRFRKARGCVEDDVSSSDLLVSSLNVDPVHPNIVYAGSNGGLYYTTDYGHTWKLAIAKCISGNKVTVGAIWATAYSPKGNSIYAGLWDGTVRVASLSHPTQWSIVASLPGQFLSSMIFDSRDPQGHTLWVAATGAKRGSGRDAAGVYQLDLNANPVTWTVLADSELAGENHYLGSVPVWPYLLVKTAPAFSLAQSNLDPDMLFLSQVAGGIFWRSQGAPLPSAPPTAKPSAPPTPTALPSMPGAPAPPPVHTNVPTALPTPTGL
ncbi:MAG: WD40/YVTN/BNR-like repeat-containing protein [Actinomycetota bacterium]